AANYNITYVAGDLTITPRALTITADPQSKTYGTSLVLGTSAFTPTGVPAAGEAVTAVTLTSTSGNDASLTALAGTYAGDIVPSLALGTGGFLAANYNITYVAGDLTITPRALTITADPQSKTYGTSLVLGTSAFTPTGVPAAGEAVTAVTLTSTSGNDASLTALAGTYAGDIVPSLALGTGGFLAANYNITYVAGDLTITPRALTITADPQSKTSATSLVLGTSAFPPTGVPAAGEAVTAVTLTSTSGNDASLTALAGTYAGGLVPSLALGTGGFLAANYNITYVAGDLTITTRALTI